MSTDEIVTRRLCERLEQGTVPWHRPWSGGDLPKNLVSQKLYRGVNVWRLAAQPSASPSWLTFRQRTDIGGRLRPGERGTPIVFWKFRDDPIDPDVTDVDAQHAARPFLRYHLMWNTEQCELTASLTARLQLPQPRSFDSIQQCERVVVHMP
jgi:antirestriction protein ArdC